MVSPAVSVGGIDDLLYNRFDRTHFGPLDIFQHLMDHRAPGVMRGEYDGVRGQTDLAIHFIQQMLQHELPVRRGERDLIGLV